MHAAPDLTTFIRTSAWARQLGERELHTVLRSSEQARFRNDEAVVRHGDEARHWVGLMDGVLVQQVVGANGKAASLTAAPSGAWFGEGTLLRRGAWQYNALSRRDTLVALVPIEVFEELMATSLQFNQYIARLMNNRLSHFMGLLANERLTSTESRLAHTLASLFDPQLYPARAPLLRIRQADIAQLAGISRQRANVALKSLAAQGLVSVEREGVRVLDVAGLAAH